MQHTTNYNLNVIEQSDKILDSVTALGQNATSIDTILTSKPTASLVTTISSASTDTQVPSAKGTYDKINNINILKVNLSSDDTFIPSGSWQWHTVALNSKVLDIGGGLTFNSTNHCITINENALIQIDWVVTMGLSTGTTTARYVAKISTNPNDQNNIVAPRSKCLYGKWRCCFFVWKCSYASNVRHKLLFKSTKRNNTTTQTYSRPLRNDNKNTKTYFLKEGKNE